MTDAAHQGVTLPAPRTPDPQQAPPLRWGLLGAGWIADKFVTSLRAHTTQIPYAVWAPVSYTHLDVYKRQGADGFFVGPTLFDKVSTDMSIYTDEIFGPVLSVCLLYTSRCV